jgi:peptidoglycan-N-acetylglucosamine deacetylase
MKALQTQILLTVDVEDWFQVENFKQYISISDWPTYELRVEKNVNFILDLLDSISLKVDSDNQNNSEEKINNIFYTNNNVNPKATFFVLGWIAERLPHLIREIYNRGHEIASHGYSHNLCYNSGNGELHEDLSRSKKLLEDIIAVPVYGYRAPSFSINNEVLKVIQDCGYLYDSSYNSFGFHGRYGQLDLSDFQKDGIVYKVADSFYELPISNLQFSLFNLKSSIFNSVFPWGGGGYFRLIPFTIFKSGILSILKKNGAYLFYIHPWEIDHKQPRVNEASTFFKFRHYINLKNCYSKLHDLLNAFRFSNFVNCKQYLNQYL